MAEPVSGSIIANRQAERRRINESRRMLGLGERGVTTPQREPPPTAPTAGQPGSAPVPTEGEPTEAVTPGEGDGQEMRISMPPAERKAVLSQIEGILQTAEKQKKAKMAKVMGPARRFWGGGI